MPSKMFTYYVSTAGNKEPQSITAEEDDLPSHIIDLFTGEAVNEFGKLPLKSRQDFVAWIKANYISS